jgi:hypothetical protein
MRKSLIIKLRVLAALVTLAALLPSCAARTTAEQPTSSAAGAGQEAMTETPSAPASETAAGTAVTPDAASDEYPMLVCSSEEILLKIKELITSTNEEGDDTAFNNLLYVMREGLAELAEPGRYKGFILPEREMGADLYISPAGHIYLMAYGLDDSKYVFYTTDIAYHGWLEFPDFLDIDDSVDMEDIEFEYNGNIGQSYEDPEDSGGRQ